MLTIQILTRDNEGTITRTLESVRSLGARIVVGDLGSVDSTKNICRDFGAEVVEIKWRRDYSAARNSLVADGMNLMVEPWEYLVKGHDELLGADCNSSVMVMRGKVASRELRVWRGAGFKNPAYEVVAGDEERRLEVALVAAGWPDRRKELDEICSTWRESRPTSPESWYYSAFSSLALGDKRSFINFAEKYLAMVGTLGPAEVQVYYKMASVMASEGRLDKASGFLTKCLAVYPTFAEFWCMIGDFFMKMGRYDKARSMYMNAMVIGSRRKANEIQPVHIEKYRKYPESMVKKIEEMARHQG